MISKYNNLLSKITGDLVYSIAGLCLMNGVIQLLVNPFLQQKMGSSNFGIALSLLSVSSVICATFGTSLNYSRVLAHSKGRNCNGDYNFLLLLIAALCVPVCFLAVKIISGFSLMLGVGFWIYTSFSVLRYYGDVDFRINVNFKRFFIYYALIAIGYIVGVAVYKIFPSWLLVYTIAELFAVIYVFAKGKLFRANPFAHTVDFNANVRSSLTLIGTNLLSSLVLNIDRPIILKLINAESVSVFYTATLIGKVVSLLTMPLNGVIISYLAKFDGKLSRKLFVKISAVVLAVGIIITACCVLVSYVFIKIMYSDLYNAAKPLIPLAVSGQIFYFISGTLMVTLMRFTSEKLQLYVNAIHFAIFIVALIIGIKLNGLIGATVGILIANITRYIVTVVLGCFNLENTFSNAY